MSLILNKLILEIDLSLDKIGIDQWLVSVSLFHGPLTLFAGLYDKTYELKGALLPVTISILLIFLRRDNSTKDFIILFIIVRCSSCSNSTLAVVLLIS